MRLLPIVLLFSYLFLGGSANQGSTDDADCDDPTVFQAADEVLKSLNDVKEDGNQFVLYRITEATKKEETGRVKVFIKFKIQESVCPVKNAIYWQRCAFKEDEADSGECSANVLVNTETKSEEIISQNCSTTKGWQPKTPKQRVVEPIVTDVQHSCLGCMQAIDTNSEILLPILQSAIEKMNRVGNHRFYFVLENVTKAEQQVVSGWNYNLMYKIRQTNCSKSLFPKWTPAECSLDKNGQEGHCSTQVFVTPYEEIHDIQLNCQSSTGFCLSCPDRVENNDPELLDTLKQFIEKYNSHSNHTKYYKFLDVQTASRKLVENKKQYTVMFRIQETNCSKSDHNILRVECNTEAMGKNLSCEADITVADETVNIMPNYKCDVSPVGAAGSKDRTIVKGFSPFRSISKRRISRSPEKSKSKEHKPDHKEQKNAKKQKKDKDKKDKNHNGKHGDSSEESEENHRHKPQVLPRPPQHIPQVPKMSTSMPVATTKHVNPTNVDNAHGPSLTQPPSPLIPNHSHSLPLTTAVPNQQGTYPNIHETIMLELPVLVSESVPKCPGKLWQPLLPNLKITTDKPFVIEGLSFNDDDLLPENVPIPDTVVGFTDSDLEL